MRRSALVLSLVSAALLIGCGSLVASNEPVPVKADQADAPAAESANPVESPAPPAAVAEVEAQPAKPQMFKPGSFEDPKVCSTCHCFGSA